MPEAESGGGYSGPLACRQRKPMRPDVARAFDRLAAAARADGIHLIVTSGYRSDAEQADLHKRHPDPKWVAPPGKSLHRLGTELNLGPRSAYGWLAQNAERSTSCSATPGSPGTSSRH
jgi:LAS superfamily LD-carboxypeptidase LdcB